MLEKVIYININLENTTFINIYIKQFAIFLQKIIIIII